MPISGLEPAILAIEGPYAYVLDRRLTVGLYISYMIQITYEKLMQSILDSKGNKETGAYAGYEGIGGGGVNTLILNSAIDIGMNSFTPWPIYPSGKSPQQPLNRRLG